MRISVCIACLALLLLVRAPAFAIPQAVTGLPATLRATLANHPAVKGKLAEVTAQKFGIETAKAGRYPSLSGQVSTYDKGEDYASLRVRQPLWAFGKIDTPISRAKAQLRVEELALLQVQRQLVEETAAVYAHIRGIRQRLRVADENIAEHRKLYGRIERRMTGQLASEADVRLAFSRLTQAESQRERLTGELQVALEELWALTLVEVDTGEPVDPALVELAEPEAVAARGMKASADILYKMRLIEVAEYTMALEKIASTPTLYAEAQKNFYDSSDADDSWAGLTLEGSINGAGLETINRFRSASAEVDAARQDLRSTENDTQLRLQSLLTNLDLQTRLQRSQRAAVEAVRDTRESFYRQYDTGRKTWVEVLNIQRELTEQRLQLAQAESDQLTISLRLAALIGQLDGTAGIAAPPTDTLQTK